MWPAYGRSVQLAPPKTIDELRPRKGEIALLCTLPECPACRKFTSKKAAFEKKHFRSSTKIIDWDCSNQRRSALATTAGVDDIPAYIVIGANGPPTIVPTDS